uniref:Family with sequence similarity 221 member B n=1 Tax=Terrapene triunguis TaxID=2587831 RepID=A0A674JJP7_9SAUR
MCPSTQDYEWGLRGPGVGGTHSLGSRGCRSGPTEGQRQGCVWEAQGWRLPLPTHPAHLCPGYTVRPIVPARRAELVAVAKAMHRDQFGREVQELFHLEREAALTAMQTGLYIGWRCPEYLWDCFRVGDLSKCFCGHLLREHQVYSDVTLSHCKCQSFIFIPSRPEDVGEFWLRKRVGFDPSAWRATCRCKHSHEEHAPALPRTGCWCVSFESNFLCAACDRRWEEHETFFETAETRRKGGQPYGMHSTWPLPPSLPWQHIGSGPGQWGPQPSPGPGSSVSSGASGLVTLGRTPRPVPWQRCHPQRSPRATPVLGQSGWHRAPGVSAPFARHRPLRH